MAPAAKRRESPGRNGATTNPVSLKMIANRIPYVHNPYAAISSLRWTSRWRRKSTIVCRNSTRLAARLFVHQSEVHLAFFRIDPDHLHGHLVAQPVALFSAPSDEGIMFLVVDVIIVFQVSHADEPFHEEVGDLYEHSEIGDAGNDRMKHIPDVPFHVLHLHDFHRCALRIRRDALPVRGLLADLRELLRELEPSPVRH